MEKNFYNDEFEEFIKQKSGQYKMYPSDKVWRNIHSSLHTRRKWFFVGMFSLITGILIFAGNELLAPSTHMAAKKVVAANNENINPSILTPNKKNTDPVANTAIFTEYKVSVSPIKQTIGNNNIVNADSLINVSINPEPVNGMALNAVEYNEDDYNVPATHKKIAATIIAVADKDEPVYVPEEITNEISENEKGPISNSSVTNKEDLNKIALLENYAPYELASTKKLNRKYWQLYVTPTMNYRKLGGASAFPNTKSNVQYVPIAAAPLGSNPNQYTNNKPALGFELGSSFLYRYTRNLSFKVGLQFNYSRYTIDAYALNTQPATIILNSISPYQTNSITSNTNIGTIGGKAAVMLQNQYFQISAPLGFELRIMGNEKLQLHVGASIQPTYLLNRNSYLLSSDYTNYTQEPSLFRKWNAYGAVEAFVSYKLGKLRLQLGPQFSYQLFSTYTSQYPITENLKDFGIKMGISKTIW